MKHLLLFLSLLVSTAQAHETVAADDMAVAANNLIDSLNPEQKAIALFSFDREQRYDWHFIPKERKGLPLTAMNARQRDLAGTLLASGLSSQGLAKAKGIMNLEEALQVLEGLDSRQARNPQLYYISIFGEPGPGSTWGWRFEGHHLSLSFTIVKGMHISATPSFMGSNPAIVASGPHAGLAVLADEENRGRELVKSLSTEQRMKAVIAEIAPADIITSNRRSISPLEPQGIDWTELSDDQQVMLWKLVNTYVRRARGEIADVDLQKVTDAGRDNLHFAWAGGMEQGEGHYYRIQGPTFLLEFDNTQNNANHIHAVFRDFTEDFGEDLLREHYEESHHH